MMGQICSFLQSLFVTVLEHAVQKLSISVDGR